MLCNYYVFLLYTINMSSRGIYLVSNYSYSILGKKHILGKAALKRSRDKTKLRRKLTRKLNKLDNNLSKSQTCDASSNSDVITKKNVLVYTIINVYHFSTSFMLYIFTQ